MNTAHSTVSAQLLHANQLGTDEIARALSAISAHQVDYADIYCQRTASAACRNTAGLRLSA